MSGHWPEAEPSATPTPAFSDLGKHKQKIKDRWRRLKVRGERFRSILGKEGKGGKEEGGREGGKREERREERKGGRGREKGRKRGTYVHSLAYLFD